ncbi:TPA: hypothetical protein ACSP2F_000054 [Aeromonas veronii]
MTIDWGKVVTVAEKDRLRSEQGYAKWKQERAALVAAIVVTVGGHAYQGDELSQGRMARTIAASSSDSDTVEWTLSDNTVYGVQVSEIREALRLSVMEQTRIWNNGRPDLVYG